MSTCVLFASPHKDGHTMQHTRQVVSAGEASYIFLYEKNIRPCTDCGKCKETGRCIINDDFQMVYDETQMADEIVIAFPLYFDSFPSPLKAFIDRLQCVYLSSFGSGRKIELSKKGIAVITAGSSKAQPPQEKTMKHIFSLLHAQPPQIHFFCGTDK